MLDDINTLDLQYMTDIPDQQFHQNRAHPLRLELFTDLYELTMAQALFSEGLTDKPATFSAHFRNLPSGRNFLLACGLDTILEHFENLSFSDDAVSYLDSTRLFTDSFLDWIKGFQFTCNVRAIAEGTPVFPDEPLLEVNGPIIEAQIVETFVLNQIHLQTILASKAARIVSAAGGHPVIDFGARRAHGIDAAVKAARAFTLAGISGTSNVLAGQIYDLPLIGTMAHSFVQAFPTEEDAFRSFIKQYPESTLLVDTYDTLEGVRCVVNIAKELGNQFKVKAIRLDSGNIVALAAAARKILDEAGLEKVQIIASGGLDEWTVSEVVDKGAPVDGFGIGTRMIVAEDNPAAELVYKLTEFSGTGKLKTSLDKKTIPGSKQVWRSEEDSDVGDIIGRVNETHKGRPLLDVVMVEGKRLPESHVPLGLSHRYALKEISKLPKQIRNISVAKIPYPVVISDKLKEFQRKVLDEIQN